METLKEFRTIILGHRIIVYTDHKNLRFETFTTERVMHWRLMLEKYGPEIKYTKGADNDAVEALSRVLLIKLDITERDITRDHL